MAKARLFLLGSDSCAAVTDLISCSVSLFTKKSLIPVLVLNQSGNAFTSGGEMEEEGFAKSIIQGSTLVHFVK